MSNLSDSELEALLAALREQKEKIMVELRKAVAEQDKRVILADMKRRYGDKAVQVISNAGGIASAEAVGKPS